MAERIITLLEPIEGPGVGSETTQIMQIKLREPKYPDIMRLGEPAAFGRSEGGIMFTSEKDDVIDAYIRRLMIEPKDPNLLAQVGAADTIQLREAIFDFFKIARMAAFPRQSKD